MKKIVVLSAVLFSGLAVAQGLPRSSVLPDLVRPLSVRLLSAALTRSLHALVGNHHPRSRAVGCGLSDAF